LNQIQSISGEFDRTSFSLSNFDRCSYFIGTCVSLSNFFILKYRNPVGLDGVYRLSPGEYDLPQGNRGHWIDAQTFMLEHDEIANNDHILFLMQFAGDRVIVEGRETDHELGARLEGRI
jgi:hypothetical protein